MSELILEQITPMVITFNEAPNLERCLNCLTWAQQVLIVDSGSTDETIEISRRYRNARVIDRPFDDFASQCNFGLSQIATPWVLSLDADYELSPDVIDELSRIEASHLVAYQAAFVYCIYGKPLRATLYPPRKILYLREFATYRNEGHGHRVVVSGATGRLKSRIRHDDRKPLSRWLTSQQQYAKLEADYLYGAAPDKLSRTDRVRLMGWPAPLLIFFFTLIAKRCLLDGWAGWFYVLQRTLAETMIALEVADRRLRSSKSRRGCVYSR